MVLIDVDEFKTVNDTFGHSAGGAVLRLVACVLAEADAAVHHAKHAGRDRVASAPSHPRPGCRTPAVPRAGDSPEPMVDLAV